MKWTGEVLLGIMQEGDETLNDVLMGDEQAGQAAVEWIRLAVPALEVLVNTSILQRVTLMDTHQGQDSVFWPWTKAIETAKAVLGRKG